MEKRIEENCSDKKNEAECWTKNINEKPGLIPGFSSYSPKD
jgi:hypothetical protein